MDNSNESEIKTIISRIRTEGKEAMEKVLSEKKNISIIEKYIYNRATTMVDTKEEFNITAFEKVYKRVIYQSIGDLMKGKKLADIRKVLNNVKTNKVGWRHSCYLEITRHTEEHDNYLENPFELVEGIAECGKCGNNKVFSYQVQTRSVDEPMTTINTCSVCRNRWTYSG